MPNATRKLIFNLKVEIPLDTKLSSLVSNEPSIYFDLDVNPSNEIFEGNDDVLHKDFIIKSLQFVERYLDVIESHVNNMVIARKAPAETVSKMAKAQKGPLQTKELGKGVVQINRGGYDPIHLNKAEIYHLSPRRISRIVYRKNSPVLGNVLFAASSNGDVQPPGTKRP